MTRVFRNAALACAGILVASAALANVPDPSQTQTINFTGGGKPDVIAVEGRLAAASTLPDSCETLPNAFNATRCAKFTVIVKDFAGNLIPGSLVTIDFSACPDISISCNQLTAATGQTAAAGKKVSGVTNAVGSFTFQVQGAATSNTLNNGGVTTAGTLGASGGLGGTACAQLYADGVPIKQLRVSAFDSNGAFAAPAQDGVTGFDASQYAKEIANCLATSSTCRERDDVDQNSFVQGTDAARESLMATDALGGTGSKSTGSYCP